MPISGEGTLSSPAVPKYRAKVEVQHNYVFDSNGEPMYVEYTTTDEIGAELLKNADVEKVNDESVVEGLKRAGASEADIERTLTEWGLKEPAVEE
jgi:hypothetical protein